jgi:hypothetical protein
VQAAFSSSVLLYASTASERLNLALHTVVHLHVHSAAEEQRLIDAAANGDAAAVYTGIGAVRHDTEGSDVEDGAVSEKHAAGSDAGSSAKRGDLAVLREMFL